MSVMTPDDLGGSGSPEQARKHQQRLLQELKVSAKAAYEAIAALGLSSKQVARSLGYASGTYRRLKADGDGTGWHLPPQGLCEAMDSYCHTHLHRSFELAARRKELAAAEDALKKAVSADRNSQDDQDLRDTRHAAYREPLRAYLEALSKALATTSRWTPHPALDQGFEARRVSIRDTPPASGSPDTRYDDAHALHNGDVSWRRAVEGVPVAVVLADAGYGKTWTLRHYGWQLCQEALAALDGDVDQAEVAVPLFLHCADLARYWDDVADGPSAVVAAGLRELGGVGYAASSAFRAFLAERLAEASAPVSILVDAYDEVFEDRSRAVVRQGLRWLQARASATDGPRVVLTSRRSGYDHPFVDDTNDDDRETTTYYLSLGILEESQVLHLWNRWYGARGRGVPWDRLEPAIAPASPLRRFVRVPLVAAFCAWVAEKETVAATRAGLYGQVVCRFLAQAWKADAIVADGMALQDGARRAAHERSLSELAWWMATDGGVWRDAVSVADCEDHLQSGPVPLPGRSRTWELVRQAGILIQPGANDGEPLGDAPVLWIHRSVQEYLAATELVKQSADDVAAAIDGVMWFHPAWANVLDFALGLEVAEEVSKRTVTKLLRTKALDDHDGLGWFATVYTGAISGLPVEADTAAAVVEHVWKLYRAGFLSPVHLARVLALVPGAGEAALVNVLTASIDEAADDHETTRLTWQALAWCGTPGRERLADIIRSRPHAAGAATALHQVDPAAARSALGQRLHASLPVSSAEALVIHDLDQETVAWLDQRYRDQPAVSEHAEILGLTRSALALRALSDQSKIRNQAVDVRMAAVSGLLAFYGNDLDLSGLSLLTKVALHDPDPQVRIGARESLERVAFVVPWVDKALRPVFAELHADPDEPAVIDLKTLVANLRKNSPGLQKAVAMVQMEPELLKGPVLNAISALVADALQGMLDVTTTKELLLIGGEEILELARERVLARHDMTADHVANLAVGLCFAVPDDQQVYRALVDCAGAVPHVLIKAGLGAHEAPPTTKLRVLLEAMAELPEARPRALRVWGDAAREVLLEVSSEERVARREAFGVVTARILALGSEKDSGINW